jgi:hypothetical protein
MARDQRLEVVPLEFIRRARDSVKDGGGAAVRRASRGSGFWKTTHCSRQFRNSRTLPGQGMALPAMVAAGISVCALALIALLLPESRPIDGSGQPPKPLSLRPALERPY